MSRIILRGCACGENWCASCSLSGIFLAVTGTEAAYADLGHFSRRAIQVRQTLGLPSLGAEPGRGA